MSTLEIVSIVATFLGVTCFSAVFTILYTSYVRSTVAQTEAGKRDVKLIDEALRQRDKKIQRRKKVLSVLRTALFVLFLLIIVPLFLFSLITRIADGRPVFGKTVLVVASGSMSFANEENAYLADLPESGQAERFDRYDIILLDRVDSPDELKQYDVIAYRSQTGQNIIHRIRAIEGAGEEVRFRMRGDANNEDDVETPGFSDVIGVYRGARLRSVGVVVMFLQSYSGIITVAAVLYCLIMIDIMYRKIKKCEDARLKQLLDAIGNDVAESAMRAEFRETIYYRGFAYRFDETGFVGKTPIPEGEAPAEENVMVKEFGDGTPAETIVIETKQEPEKPEKSEKD